MSARLAWRLSEHANVPAATFQYSSNDLERGGLSGAVCSDESENLSGLNLKADLVERLERAVALCKLIGLDDDISSH
jgi:hypothetical protein